MIWYCSTTNVAANRALGEYKRSAAEAVNAANINACFTEPVFEYITNRGHEMRFGRIMKCQTYKCPHMYPYSPKPIKLSCKTSLLPCVTYILFTCLFLFPQPFAQISSIVGSMNLYFTFSNQYPFYKCPRDITLEKYSHSKQKPSLS